jgi:hypothetical protein
MSDTFFNSNSDICKDEFVKTGMWPNETMWQLWCKAWNAALQSDKSYCQTNSGAECKTNSGAGGGGIQSKGEPVELAEVTQADFIAMVNKTPDLFGIPVYFSVYPKSNTYGIANHPITDDKTVWVVLDETGEPIHCASWPEACHEHINDAINEHQIEGAEKWVVRKATI